MSGYIHFTEEQKQRAAAVDLEEFLRCRGEKLITSGREKRLVSDHSITVRGNEWYDHAEERGGHAVSFVQKFYGLSYPEAVTMLLGNEVRTYPSAKERVEELHKPFVLPSANKDMRRIYAYDMIPHNVRTRYWIIYAMYRLGSIEMARGEIEHARADLTTEGFDTLVEYLKHCSDLPLHELLR